MRPAATRTTILPPWLKDPDPFIKEDGMPSVVLALTPHPDDAEIFAGGTIAGLIAGGARAYILVATDGRRGSFEHDSPALAEMRAEEGRRAALALGAEPPIMLGYPDLELDHLPPGVLREAFIRAIRQYRPDAVIAEDPFAPYDPHPDHRAVAWAASDALSFSQLPLMHPEHLKQGLQPHFVTEKYFYSEHLPSTNRVVDISATMDVKLQALAEHKSQVTFLVEGVMRQARLAGLDIDAILGSMAGEPKAAMEWALRSQAAAVGARIGVAYGEAFRYARFDPLVENLLSMQS
jgi:LmbE family N-acetylglucosaminyl deacetylase